MFSLMSQFSGKHKSLLLKYIQFVVRFLWRMKHLTFVALVLVAVIFLFAKKISRIEDMLQEHRSTQLEDCSSVSNHKLFMLISEAPSFQQHVVNILERNGYRQTHDFNDDWTFLWTHYNPFYDIREKMLNLRPGQRVNHLPGTGYITSKDYVSMQHIKGIPPSFNIPHDKARLLDWIRHNPSKMIVTKNNGHRGVKIRNVKDIDFDVNESISFAQEFIQNPLLVDGYKFDIGVYVTVTSINPLRLYVHQSDVLLRFCPEKYLPFDANNMNKYVVHDDYLPAWKVPSISKYYNEGGFSGKDSLNAYIRSLGKNPDTLWDKVDESLVDLFASQEKKVDFDAREFPNKNAHSEMMRVDFVIDEDLNVWLMEANMSPNLSSAHFPPNRLLYEQVIHSTLRLTGIISASVDTDLFHPPSQEALDMEAASKDLYVNPSSCSTNTCSSYSSCSSPECELCKNCLSPEERQMLVEGFLEHSRQFATRRIFPEPVTSQEDARQEKDYSGVSTNNRKMDKWFRGKCLVDKHWCSG